MKTKANSVSAVMFVYNEEKYIAEMLTSVLNQDVPVTKLIIIDDYSTDSTLNIIGEFQKDYSNIEVFQSKQKGKVFAYITGLEKVTTDYFFVCAGDDYLLPNYVSELLREIKEKNLDFIYAKYFITDAKLENPIALKRKSSYSRAEILRANRVSGYLFGKSTIINNVVLPLPTNVSFEDWITSLKLADAFSSVNLSSKPLFYYRKHQASTSERLQNIGMRKRDIEFINFLLTSPVIDLSKGDVQVLQTRLRYYRQLSGRKSYSEIIKLLTSKELFTIDRIRLLLLLNPLIKDDNGAQKVINKLAKFIP